MVGNCVRMHLLMSQRGHQVVRDVCPLRGVCHRTDLAHQLTSIGTLVILTLRATPSRNISICKQTNKQVNK